MDILQLLMVVVVFVLAGGVKGVTGMGLPTVAVSLLGLWMPPVQAAALLVIPSLATNIAQCRGPHLRSLVSRLWPGWLAIAIVTLSAPGLGDAVSVQTTKGWLGGILMAYGIWGLWRPQLPDLSLTSKWLSLPTGVATVSLAVKVQMSAPLGLISSSVAIAVGGALIGALSGLKLGELLRSRLVGPVFQKALFMVFLGLGAANLIQAH